MKKSICLQVIIFLFIIPFCCVSQTISTGPLSGSEFCAGSYIYVDYNVTGTFQPDNVFIVQLSNNNFSTFQNIGNLKRTDSSTVYALIPSDLSEASNYRVRVISSNPYTVGSDNGTDFKVYESTYGSTEIKYDDFYHGTNEDVTINLSYGNFKNFSLNWNFGKDASPQSFSGIIPPKVRYSSTGKKIIACDVNAPINCTNKTKDTSTIYIMGCEVSIDSSAFVDSVNYKDGDYEIFDKIYRLGYLGQIWMLPNSSIDKNLPVDLDEKVIIMETGANLSLFDCRNSIFYLKPGASLVLKYYLGYCAIIRAPGASIMVPDSGGIKILDCPNIKFNYSAAPKEGVAAMVAMGYLDVKESENDLSTIYITPNPVSDFLEISVRAQRAVPLQNIEIFSVMGMKVLTTPALRATPHESGGDKVMIDVSSLPQGIYFVKVGDKVSKFVKI